MFKKGEQVRVKADITQQGITTGRIDNIGNRKLVEVNVLGLGNKKYPEEYLEHITEQLSPLSQLTSKKYVGPENLRLLLAHIRLTGRLADMIYSMESTNTQFLAYQFKPVLKIINSPSNSILIADEVGLGKTIEAGLIWTELRARYDAKRLIVLCPFTLTNKWQEELLNKFGIDARIVKADELYNDLSNSNKINREAAYICGMQSMRPDKNWQEEDGSYEGKRPNQRKLALLLENMGIEEPNFDLLIVDEAHHLRNQETQIHKFANLLREVSDHCVFLSATPIHLKNNDLFSLLKILDEGSFESIEYFKDLVEINKPIIKARDLVLDPRSSKEELIKEIDYALNFSMLSKSRNLNAIKELILKTNLDQFNRSEIASRLEGVSLLSNIVTRMRRKDVQELRVVRNVKEIRISMSEKERIFYDSISEEVKRFADKKEISRGFLLASPQRMISSSMPAALKRWKNSYIFGLKQESEINDLDLEIEEKIKLLEKPLTERLSVACKKWNLQEIIQSDNKILKLLDLINNEYKGEKVLIFTSFRTTISYLETRLLEEGISFISIHGGIKGDVRQKNLNEFKNKTHQVLLSSEVGSEGLDLQFCKHLINYDLPWNPMKVEQRIGRIDRFGQNSKFITVINFIYEDTIDQRIYDRLFKRLKVCEVALGGFETILGEELNKLENDLFFSGINKEQEEKRIEQTAIAIENKKKEQDNLEKEAAGLIAHGDYILNKVKAAKEFNRWITTGDLKNYIISFFRQYYPSSVLLNQSDYSIIKLDGKCFTDLSVFIQNNNDTYPTNFRRQKEVEVIFGKLADHNFIKGHEVINQKHPLLRFAADKISHSKQTLTPAVYCKIKNVFKSPLIHNGTILIMISKWSILGQTNFEKINYKAIYVNSDTIINSDSSEKIINYVIDNGENVDGIDRLENNNILVEKAKKLLSQTEKSFLEFEQNYKLELIDRINFQLETSKKLFNIQNKRFREIIANHNVSGNKGLAIANENKLEKLTEKFNIKETILKKGQNFAADMHDIAIVAAEIY